uniref:hypothetical protein n=1 Tax=Flavobacterium sp. TaxID=239 RepID=UPI00404AFA88
MKTIYILLVLLATSFQTVLSQTVGDDFPKFEEVSTTSFHTNTYNDITMVKSADLIGNKNFKKNTTYNKVLCKVGDEEMWFSGKFKEKKFGHQYYFEVVGSKYYLSNNQVYDTYEKFTSKDENYSVSTIYHENGQIKQQLTYYFNDKSQFENKFDKYGTLTRSYSSTYASTIDHPDTGIMRFKTISPAIGAPPNFHTYEDGNSYLGYQYVGTLFTVDNLEITGFFASLKYERGNGGVFFVENTLNNNCSWITVLNYEIIAVTAANCDEKPNIHELNKEIVSKEYQWKIPKISENDKAILGIDKDAKKYKIWFSEDYLEIESSKESNLNGYHFSMKPVNNTIYNDGLLITCGTYKDGKLDGMGFKAHIDFKTNISAMGPSTTKLGFVSGRWDMEAGYFENNNFSNGRKFSNKNYYYFKNVDNFSEIKIPNFEYKGPGNNVSDAENVSIQKIRVNSQIYSRELKRKLKVIALDNINGTITTETDIEGKLHTFDIQKDLIYFYVPVYKDYTYQCYTTVKKPFYKEIKTLLYYKAGESKTSSYTVTGVYYDKKVTKKSYTPGAPVYGTKYVIDRYDYVTCPKCSGKGFTTVTKNQGHFARVVL